MWRVQSACVLLFSALASPASAQTHAPMPEGLGIQVELENPEALSRFVDALAWTEAGLGQTRIAVWGASHTASDHWTGYLRSELQDRYGDAGRGWSLVAWQNARYPYWQWGVEIDEGSGWTRRRLDRTNGEAGYYGIANMLFAAESAPATARIATSTWGVGRTFSSLELFYFQQPEGGRFELGIDGNEEVVNTRGELAAQYHRVRVPDGAHEVSVDVPAGENVGLYGFVLERDTPGVILDNFAITAGRARDNLRSLDPVFSEQLRRRSPHLVIFAYGGNEANDAYIPIAQFARDSRLGLEKVLAAAPGAACLLLGPFDKPKRRGNRWVPRRRVDLIEAHFRELAIGHGCAFFDTRSFMGGPMSMLEWVTADPPLARDDYVHLSARGYERLGEVLLENLTSIPPR